jgi:hypothetical protein
MLAAALALACGDPAAHVHLVPLGGNCGRPLGANQVKVTAYAASGERSQSLGLSEAISIADFPSDTEQIGVEVSIGGGETGAEGKSAPLGFDALADGAVIPVLMAPPDGLCELPAMTEPRAQPLVARAGDGALIVGGTGPSGPLSTAEYYDPTTATFSAVDVPRGLSDPLGFTGAALATLPDGRVVLIGGPHPVFAVFDPRARGFVAAPTLIEPWAFHAAIATDDQEVLVAGGCNKLTTPCDDSPPRSLRYPLTRPDLPMPAAVLAPGQRSGARLFDLGVQLDGRRRYLLAGGSGAPGRADRFALDDASAEVLPGGHAQVAALDGGAVLAAFGDDAAASPADGAAAVYAPDAAAARPISGTSAVKGVRLIALEDGRVAGFGGDPMGRVLIYDPTHDAWQTEAPASDDQTGPLNAPSLVRLADGTVLVLGGAVSARAWLYRPPLTGPASGSITSHPASDAGRAVLTAPDPATVTRVTGQLPAWLLTTPPGAVMARALLGGPRTVVGSIVAIVQVLSGGVALIAQQTGPGQALVAELAPGGAPRLVRLDGGAEHEICATPPALAPFDAATPVTLRLALSDRDARLSIDGREILVCSLAATDRGAWGIASLGAGAQLAVASVTVARRP